jgi:hypothetical protein
VGLDGVMPLKIKIGNAGATQVTFRGEPVELPQPEPLAGRRFQSPALSGDRLLSALGRAEAEASRLARLLGQRL